ncbi:MAG: hypothetical protein ABW095_06405, partial [Candidatus Thiodiazotropha sp.]
MAADPFSRQRTPVSISRSGQPPGSAALHQPRSRQQATQAGENETDGQIRRFECLIKQGQAHQEQDDAHQAARNGPRLHKRVFDLMKDFGTSKSTKIDSIFDSLLVPR